MSLQLTTTLPTRVSFEPNTTLLMFSGGLDSLGALWLLLERGRTVHVHHVMLVTVEQRYEVERAAVRRCLEWLKAYGHRFTESHSVFKTDAYRDGFLYDADSFNLIGAGMAHLSRGAIVEVAIGATLSDDTPEGRRAAVRGRAIYDLITKVPKVYPVGHLTKREIWQMLPHELRARSWTCRRPIVSSAANDSREFVPCRICKSCKALAAAQS